MVREYAMVSAAGRPGVQIVNAGAIGAIAARGSAPASSPSPADILGGDDAMAAVQRALTEFRAGRPVILTAPGRPPLLALPVDGLTSDKLSAIARLSMRPLTVVVTRTRAAALGADSAAAATIRLSPDIGLDDVLALAAARSPAGDEHGQAIDVIDAGVAGFAATELAKLALLLPAVVAVDLDAAIDVFATVPRVASADVLGFHQAQARSLRLVSSARVPLAHAAETTFHIFRDSLGQSWTAVIIGTPDRGRPVPVRLHSACLTGDAFGSLRCDCGDQLRLSIEMLERMGGGLLLYLDQEGCGIGLANKMRAYRLQDDGLDTIDANTALGFERDERRYDIAARMLQTLGVSRIALLTNNPVKLAGLRRAGIEIAERIALLAPIHDDNRLYLQAKQQRAGHLIGDAAEPRLREPTPVC